MHKKLHGIATVATGYTFRGAVVPDAAGDLLVVQAHDIGQSVTELGTVSLIATSQHIPEYAGHLQRNDILLVARGLKSGSFRSAVFVSDEPNVIASSSVHIIRVTDPEVSPYYLSLYFNSKDGQRNLAQIVSGSYVGAISRKELLEIEIPVPTKKKQESIVQLYKNIQIQKKILDRRNELKQQIIDATFINIAAQ